MSASFSGRCASSVRRGFTLFEVSISLLIISVTVITVLAVFPAGLRQLQMGRYKAYASAMACQLIDLYSQRPDGSRVGDMEGSSLWDVNSDRCAQQPDLEKIISNSRMGLMPLPVEIARRLDSTNDEIGKILDGGGYVYYMSNQPPVGISPEYMPSSAPSYFRNIIVGVVGPAQHNASVSCSLKRWPYYTPVPGGPLSFQRYVSDGALEYINDATYGINGYHTFCWQYNIAQSARLLDLWKKMLLYYKLDVKAQTAVPQEYKDYLEAAFAYAGEAFSSDISPLFRRADSNISLSAYYESTLRSMISATTQDSSSTLVAAKKVLAINYLCGAITALTRWNTYANLSAGVSVGEYSSSATSVIPSMTNITHDNIVNLGENTRYIYYLFCANHPYNWGVPRPYEHAVMMDYPLLELDLFSDQASGSVSILGSSAFSAKQWKYMSPRIMTTMAGDVTQNGLWMGVSASYPRIRDAGTVGKYFSEGVGVNGVPSSSHYTILSQFYPSERCRQLVFWAVDWQSYEDFETVPSAPVDASRHLAMAPQLAGGGISYFKDVNTGLIQSEMNPEWMFSLIYPGSAIPTGFSLINPVNDQDRYFLKRSTQDHRQQIGFGPPDKRDSVVLPTASGSSVNASFYVSQVQNGSFGADRNGDGRLSRGSVSPSSRMRAIEIIRFNYYDMRVPGGIR